MSIKHPIDRQALQQTGVVEHILLIPDSYILIENNISKQRVKATLH